jgi:hypothetical protein
MTLRITQRHEASVTDGRRLRGHVASSCFRRAVPWLRPLVIGLSQQGPGFDPGSCEICGAPNDNGTIFSPSASVFPSQYHSTIASYTDFHFYTVLSPEGHAHETWEPSNQAVFFRTSGRT